MSTRRQQAHNAVLDACNHQSRASAAMLATAFASARARCREAVALLVDDPSSQWNPGHGESDIVVAALLFMSCILSELEAAGGYAVHPKIPEFWTYLRSVDGEAKDLWALQYEALLTPAGRAKP